MADQDVAAAVAEATADPSIPTVMGVAFRPFEALLAGHDCSWIEGQATPACCHGLSSEARTDVLISLLGYVMQFEVLQGLRSRTGMRVVPCCSKQPHEDSACAPLYNLVLSILLTHTCRQTQGLLQERRTHAFADDIWEHRMLNLAGSLRGWIR